ncbi:MAG TPA: hypothetical protein VKQ11_01870 [Candidatus Sulfotelmatobacter sp.]|nr:hypothetical protein [Candidatus Sulfotelmatobacter sp.]
MSSFDTSTPLQNRQQRTDVNPAIAQSSRTRCFQLTDRWLTRVVRFLEAVYQGFWLGCLTADDLNAVTANYFDKSRFYASAGHNLSGFLAWEAPLIERHFQPGSRILVAGAGGGREVLAFRKAGFDAEGFECSLSLIEAGWQIFDQLGETRGVIYCPPDAVPAGAPTYGGLVIGWGAYTNIPTRQRRVSFLTALRRRALPRAPVLLSFFTRAADSRVDRVVYRCARFSQFFVRARSAPVEMGDHLSLSYFHSFARNELEDELREAGFQLTHYKDEGDWGHAIGISK